MRLWLLAILWREKWRVQGHEFTCALSIYHKHRPAYKEITHVHTRVCVWVHIHKKQLCFLRLGGRGGPSISTMSTFPESKKSRFVCSRTSIHFEFNQARRLFFFTFNQHLCSSTHTNKQSTEIYVQPIKSILSLMRRQAPDRDWFDRQLTWLERILPVSGNTPLRHNIYLKSSLG